MVEYTRRVTDFSSQRSYNMSDSSLPTPDPTVKEAPPSYVKLAMRNMVRKKGTSVFHFLLTTVGLLAVLMGLSYLTR